MMVKTFKVLPDVRQPQVQTFNLPGGACASHLGPQSPAACGQSPVPNANLPAHRRNVGQLVHPAGNGWGGGVLIGDVWGGRRVLDDTIPDFHGRAGGDRGGHRGQSDCGGLAGRSDGPLAPRERRSKNGRGHGRRWLGGVDPWGLAVPRAAGTGANRTGYLDFVRRFPWPDRLTDAVGKCPGGAENRRRKETPGPAPLLGSRTAAENAVPQIGPLHQRATAPGDGIFGGTVGVHHGCRRRILFDPGDDLRFGHAHIRGGGHVVVSDLVCHRQRYSAAFRQQPDRGRVAGADLAFRRRGRRPVRDGCRCKIKRRTTARPVGVAGFGHGGANGSAVAVDAPRMFSSVSPLVGA